MEDFFCRRKHIHEFGRASLLSFLTIVCFSIFPPASQAIDDADDDGLPDSWELAYGLDPTDGADAALDKDRDTLSNLAEYQGQTNPLWHDTDNDLLPDAEELALGSNPLVKDFSLDVSGNGESQCAIRDNELYCWGSDTRLVNPALIPAVVSPTQVSVGGNGACVVDGGDVKCWGHSRTYRNYRIYRGNPLLDHVADVNAYLGEIVEVGVSYRGACARDQAGKVFCWGENSSGQTNAPLDLQGVTQLSVGWDHSCAIAENEVRCWSSNGYSDLTVPTDLGKASYVEVGPGTTCAIAGGKLSCWGSLNHHDKRLTAMPAGLHNVTQVEVGSEHICAVNEGVPVCWGDNANGELGAGLAKLSNVRAFALGSSHSCALSDAGLSCWGNLSNARGAVPPAMAQALDVDGDGLSDADRDDDGLPDGWELVYGLDPTDGLDAVLDTDGDGQTNLEEYQAGTSPIDGDNDGINDADEVGAWPSKADGDDDSDDDGLPDGWELAYGLDPLDASDAALDKDRDTLSNLAEYQGQTNPLWHDTDNDLSPDAEELALGSNPLVNDFPLDVSGSSASQCAIRDNELYCWGRDVDNVVNPALTQVLLAPTQVSVGHSNACVVDGGDVKCWGFFAAELVGDVANANDYLDEIVEVGVSDRGACARDQAGKVFCWGENSSGQTNVPLDLQGVTQLSVGWDHSCAIAENEVRCWGANGYGQSTVPADLGKASYVNAGSQATCAIAGGELRCWGSNHYNRMSGMPDLQNVTQVEVGQKGICAVNEGVPVCWGENTFGELGVGAGLAKLSNVRAFAMGSRYSCALSDEGLICWGYYHGNLIKIPPEMTQPLDVDGDGLADAWERAHGLNPADAADAALDTDGDGQTNLEEYQAGTSPIDADNDGINDADEVETSATDADSDNDGLPDGWELAYGLDPLDASDAALDKDRDTLSNLAEYQGQTNPLWHDTDNDLSPDAEELALSSNPLVNDFPLDVSGHRASQCAIRDKELYCWGTDTNYVANPALIPAVESPTQVSVGSRNACVVDGGAVKCWGYNGYNLVSHAALANDYLDEIVEVEVGVGFFGGTCALDQAGKVFCWGENSPGQTNVPLDLQGVTQLSVGSDHNCAIAESEVRCWGSNEDGQSTVPIGLGKASYVNAGSQATCAIAGGELSCWGRNDHNRISAMPAGLQNVTQVEVGQEHICAVSEGVPVCWGDNANGELGAGLAKLSNVRAFALGSNHSCALSDAGLSCWGYLDDARGAIPPAMGQALDVDGDGMADGWEREYNLNPADVTDATLDTDGDGQTNLEEHQEGTSPIDADNDGLPDDWEREHFGDLSQDGTGDADADGVSDLDEYHYDTDPNIQDGPLAPAIVAPLFESQVGELRPELVITNSEYTGPHTVVYVFEVFSHADYSPDHLVAAYYAQPQGESGQTSWTVTTLLEEDQDYYWRVRASNSFTYSPWVDGQFRTNSENSVPTAATASYPTDAATVSGDALELVVNNSVDADGERLNYNFFIYEDIAASVLLAESGSIAEQDMGATQWLVPLSLNQGQTYYWFANVTDGHPAPVSMVVSSFTVAVANQAPSQASNLKPAAGIRLATAMPTLEITDAVDDNGANNIDYLFEVDTADSFDTANKTSSGWLRDNDSEPTFNWSVTKALAEDQTYYWRVKARDIEGLESAWVVATFRVNEVNTVPSVPVVKNPGHESQVITLTPKLELHPVVDADGDAVHYLFELYDSLFSDSLPKSQTGTSSEFMLQALEDDRWYHWRAKSIDETGAESDWSEASKFFVNENNFDNAPEFTWLVPKGGISTVVQGYAVTLRWQDEDPDSSARIKLFYADNASGTDRVTVASDLKEDQDLASDSYVFSTRDLEPGEYYFFAIIEDDSSSVEVPAESVFTLIVQENPKYGHCTSISTIEMEGEAWQSSNYSDSLYLAENAVNGNTWDFTVTASKDINAQWEFVLAEQKQLEEIVIYNRASYSDRLRDITVSVENVLGETVYESELLNPENSLSSPLLLTVNLPPLIFGNKIKIHRTSDLDFSGGDDDKNILSIAEVIVKGCSTSLTTTPPTIENPGPLKLYVGQALSYQIVATDVNNDILTFSADNLPAELVIDFQTGMISGSATTVDSGLVTVSVYDGTYTESVEFNLDVLPAPAQCTSISTIEMEGEAWQSSNYSDSLYLAENAVNGNTWDFTVTASHDINAQWEFVFAEQKQLEEIVIYNRAGYSDRLRDITVSVKNVLGETVYESELLNPKNSLSGPLLLTIDLPPLIFGNKIKIHRTSDPDFSGGGDDKNILSIAEVIVKGCSASLTTTPPTIENPGPLKVYVGQAVSHQIVATDVNSNRLTFSADNLPAGLVIDSQTGMISGLATTVDSGLVTVSVYDGTYTESVEFNLEVLPAPAQCTSITTIEMAGEAWQSSNYSDSLYLAENAVNGNTKDFTVTASNDSSAQWEFVFAERKQLEEIVIYNRADYSDRLRDITVSIENSLGDMVYETELLNPENSLSSPELLTVDLPPLTFGNKIKIHRTSDLDFSGGGDDKNILSIAEVIVWGCSAP